MPPYDVAIEPEIVSKLEDCLQQLNLAPVNLDHASGNEVSLLVCNHTQINRIFKERNS